MELHASFNYFDVMGKAKKNYARLLDPICKQWELTRNELDVLLFLYNNPQYDRAVDIVSRRGIAKSHVSLSVASLEERDLLIRHYDANDRRMAHLALTEKGKQISDQAHAVQASYFSGIHQGITPEEFEIWRRITQKVCDNIENLNKTLTTD